MISAFKHIRLSGLNLTPVEQQTIYGYGVGTRLGLGASGLAYASELISISGDLQQQINTANADVQSITAEGSYTLQGAITFSGAEGLGIGIEGQRIIFSGNSGYFQNKVDTLTNNLISSGNTILGTVNGYNSAYSGWVNGEFVQKSIQQVFTTDLSTTNLDAYAILYPVPFAAGTPKIQATLEVPGDVMYNLSIKSIGLNGYTGLLSDNILEAGAKIHTFASIQ